MRLRIIVVGKPQREVLSIFVNDYLARLRPIWPTEVVAVAEEKLTAGRDEVEVLRREAEHIREKLPESWPIVALDRTGRTMDSPAFAAQVRRWQDDGARGVAFIIGGPIGLDQQLVREATAPALSFGPMTFPHDLALVMLCEQLYRAMTIAQGWPYHR